MARRLTQVGAVAIALASVAATGVRAPSADLPNLSPAPPANVQVAPADRGTGQLALRFTTTTFNVADHHLDLLGVPTADPDAADASQCVASVGRACLEREVVGSFVFHPAHAHFHFDDYAAYSLRRVLADGSPDFSDDGLVAVGEKISFCLMDTDRTSESDEPAGFYIACQAGSQGISAGWGDSYTSGLPGQQIVIDEVEAGTYALVIEVNPDRILRETSYDDNVAWAIVELRDTVVRVRGRAGAAPTSVRVREVPLGLPGHRRP